MKKLGNCDYKKSIDYVRCGDHFAVHSTARSTANGSNTYAISYNDLPNTDSRKNYINNIKSILQKLLASIVEDMERTLVFIINSYTTDHSHYLKNN